MSKNRNYRTLQDEERGAIPPPVPHSSFKSSLSPLLQPSNNNGGIPAFQKHNNTTSPISSLSVTAAPSNAAPRREVSRNNSNSSSNTSALYIIIYGLVNSIMAIPCIFGYAAVIFNNPVFSPYINELSKVVLWSSTIHQFCFTAFSSLPFAIGQVQDAGLIFLSHMSNTMANKIMADGGTVEEVMSTTLVLLSLATFSTGIILVLMGTFKLADLVSYLPLPVVGGYLAFIGYFCLQAGVALCISKPMIVLSDWGLLWNERAFILALPGLIAGLILALVSRSVQSDAALPLLMVLIPAIFYITLYAMGLTMEDARDYGWVGEESPPVPAMDLLTLIDFSKVHWKLALDCISTWLGMVFVVSFSSCLDVAAISMDMGEVLDVNTELTTVGISNTVSGMFVGFTGSYIFSQTIFTCRTGTTSRWVGVFVAVAEIAVILSTVNVLQVVPLFFLGSTLIFIGFDLLYEWLFEVRHKILLSEFCVLLLTFISIQLLGINFGIVLGVIIAVVDYVLMTARDSSISKVVKRSRAVWKPEQWKLLKNHGYHIQNPKIVTFEIKGTVFFGSSLQLLTNLSEELSLNANAEDMKLIAMASPGPHRGSASPGPQQTLKNMRKQRRSVRSSKPARVTRPRFVVFDLSQVPNIDSSAARGCFYQLAKICSRNNVVLCASGACPRVDWVLRSHEAAYAAEDEDDAKAKASSRSEATDKIILFETVYEALEFCESNLISELQPSRTAVPLSAGGSILNSVAVIDRISLKDAFVNLLGLKVHEEQQLRTFEKMKGPFHDEVEYHAGEAIFQENIPSDGFFVVLSGSVALFRRSGRNISDPKFMSGAGSVRTTRNSPLGDVETFVPAGGIFGFCDYMLDQPWHFSAVAAKDRTVIAKLHREGLMKLKAESPELDHIVDRVLLQVSIMELANAQDL